jgi:3',5'-cyclic AMP phosphodiesterase CpdA
VRSVAGVLALLLTASLPGCFEYSPHELPDGSADRDVHRKSLERLLATPPQAPLRFAVVGDTQQQFDDARDFVGHVNLRDDIAFVVQMGDFTHLGLTFEFEVMNRVFRGLRFPYFVVFGTHDNSANGGFIYEHMFGARNLAFTYGGARIVLLDTNGIDYEYSLAVPDLAWLAAQLAPDGEHDRAIVLSHVAPNGADFTPALREPFAAVLREAGVLLSLHAHGHRFEVFEMWGVTFVLADAVDDRSYLVLTATPDGGFEYERVFF